LFGMIEVVTHFLDQFTGRLETDQFFAIDKIK
jgi:hypothetical protein